MRDTLHNSRDTYEKRVTDVLIKYQDCVVLWLEIDGIRSLSEIEEALKSTSHKISHPTLWRSAQRLLKAGLISKVAMRGHSPIYSKKIWNQELDIDGFVRKRFTEQKSNSTQS